MDLYLYVADNVVLIWGISVGARQVFCSFSEYMVPWCPKFASNPHVVIPLLIWKALFERYMARLGVMNGHSTYWTVLKLWTSFSFLGSMMNTIWSVHILLNVIINNYYISNNNLGSTSCNLKLHFWNLKWQFLQFTILIKWVGLSWDSNPTDEIV